LCSLPLVIAHRGASALATENSLMAFELAISLGADMIEFDVRRTADGVLVVHHDQDWHGQPIADSCYQELNHALEAHSVPLRLEDVVRATAHRIRLDVELKEVGYEAAALDVLARHLPARDFLVTSFSPHSIDTVKRASGIVQTGLLVEAGDMRRNSAVVARDCGAEFVASSIDSASIVLSQAAELDMPVVVWTVNEQSQLAHFLNRISVAGVITDMPDVAREIRDTVLLPVG